MLHDQATHADLFVATNGSDSWSGKLPEPNSERTDGPLASLAKARAVVRQLKQGQNRDIVTLIRGGTYAFAETAVFGLQDSAENGYSITYAAYPGETPVLSAGVPIGGWRKLDQEPEDLPERAKGHIWVADVPAAKGGGHRFFTLFDGDERLPRARSAGFQPYDPPDPVQDPSLEQPEYDTLSFPRGTLRNWPNLEDVEVVWRSTSYMNILGLSSVDEQTGLGKTSLPAQLPLTKAWNFIDNIRASCWVENVFDALDTPGEWVLDSRQGKLYLWPKDEVPGDRILVPCLSELIRVEGDVDFDGPTDRPVRGLAFKGLTFTHGERDLWTRDDVAIQHDWDMYDKPNALLRFRGAEQCLIQQCRFCNSGGTALRLDLHCQNNRIVGNLIDHVGGTGILLCGYGAGIKDVNKGNEVVNNHIHHCGELYWHGIGIFVWQSGDNRITNNLIHHVPYDAIVLSGVRPYVLARQPCPGPHCSTPRENNSTRRQDVGPVEKWERILETRRRLPMLEAEVLVRYLREVEPFEHVRNNLVQDNEIHHGLEVLGDGNAIYLSDTGKGNVIRRNFIHHMIGLGGQSAIRTDAYITDTLIADNIIYQCNCGGLNLKHWNNHAENNMIVDVPDIIDEDIGGNPPRIQRLSFGYISLLQVGAFGIPFPSNEYLPQGTSLRIQRNIMVKTDPSQVFYRSHREGNEWQEARVADCDIDWNLYFAVGESDLGQSHLQRYRGLGVDRHSIAADPLFVDLANGDLRLKPESPAFELGFRAIDAAKIGLREDLPRYPPAS